MGCSRRWIRAHSFPSQGQSHSGAFQKTSSIWTQWTPWTNWTNKRSRINGLDCLQGPGCPLRPMPLCSPCPETPNKSQTTQDCYPFHTRFRSLLHSGRSRECAARPRGGGGDVVHRLTKRHGPAPQGRSSQADLPKPKTHQKATDTTQKPVSSQIASQRLSHPSEYRCEGRGRGAFWQLSN